MDKHNSTNMPQLILVSGRNEENVRGTLNKVFKNLIQKSKGIWFYNIQIIRLKVTETMQSLCHWLMTYSLEISMAISSEVLTFSLSWMSHEWMMSG